MTAIIGLISKTKGRVTIWLGADSALTDDNGGIVTSKDEKVFTLNNGTVGLAYAGSCRVGQLLRYSLKVPNIPEKRLPRWMSTVFVNTMKECLREGGLLQKKAGADCMGDATSAVVGLRGRLFVINEDFHVMEARKPFTASGSGADLALGSLFTTHKQKGKPRDKVLAALRAAEAFSSSVRRPFRVIKIVTNK